MPRLPQQGQFSVFHEKLTKPEQTTLQQWLHRSSALGHGAHAAGTFPRSRASQSLEACTAVSVSYWCLDKHKPSSVGKFFADVTRGMVSSHQQV